MMDCLMLFRQVFSIILLYYVVPASATCYSYSSSYCYYYNSLSWSVGAIIGAVIGGIVGMVVLIVIIVIICIACNKSGSRGAVVQPMHTTSTVVSTNNTNFSHPPPMNMRYNYNQYPPPTGSQHPLAPGNQYPPPTGGSAYPPQQNWAYPPPTGVPGPANYGQPPPYHGTVPLKR